MSWDHWVGWSRMAVTWDHLLSFYGSTVACWISSHADINCETVCLQDFTPFSGPSDARRSASNTVREMMKMDLRSQWLRETMMQLKPLRTLMLVTRWCHNPLTRLSPRTLSNLVLVTVKPHPLSLSPANSRRCQSVSINTFCCCCFLFNNKQSSSPVSSSSFFLPCFYIALLVLP